jgi:hypothetical protein
MKMDLAKMPLKQLAALVYRGAKQIDELPSARRHQVAALVEQMKKEEPVEAAPVEGMTPEKPLDDMTVAELRAFATQFPDIVMESKMRKPELIATLKAAMRGEDDAS